MFEFSIDGKSFEFEDEDRSLPHWYEMRDDHDHFVGFRNEPLGMAVVYCKSPAGPYNQVVFYNRGGSVIVPTVFIDGKLYFVALMQNRPLVSEKPILEAPRGQAFIGEMSIDTAKRELLEETGLQVDEERFVYLGAGNPDTALTLGANVHAWWLRLPSEFVVCDSHGKPEGLRPDLQTNSESRFMESIRKSVLVPPEDFESPSMMTMWAAGLVFKKLWCEHVDH